MHVALAQIYWKINEAENAQLRLYLSRLNKIDKNLD